MGKLTQSKRAPIAPEGPRFTRSDVLHAMAVTLAIFIAGMLAKKLGL